MRSALAFVAALAFAPAALAQDPPPPPAPGGAAPAPAAAPAKAQEKPAAPAKRENKVTDAAKAMFESMGKKAYNPVTMGLKELKGTMEMTMQMPGMEDMEGMEGMPEMKIVFAIDFKAPKTIGVEASTDNPMLMQAADQMKQQVKQLILYGMGTMEPDAAAEYDADVVVEKAGDKETRALVIKVYEKGEARGEMKMTVDANGLPGKSVVTVSDPNTGMEQTMDITFEFTKDGEAYRLVKQIINHPMLPEPMEAVMSYSDAGGFKVLTAINSTGPMGMTFGYNFTKLSVNGKDVECPKPGKKGEEKKPDEKKPEEKKGDAAPASDGAKKPEDPKDAPK